MVLMLSLDISNAIDGDQVNQVLDIDVTAEIGQTYSCNLESSNLELVNTADPQDKITLTATLAGDCSDVRVTGTLTGSTGGKIYTGDLDLSATYD